MPTPSAFIRASATALALAGTPAIADEAVTILVFDASGSMWNRIDGELTRIEVARNVMEDFFRTRQASTPLAVIAYGHRRRGDCGDIEVIAALDRHDPVQLAGRLRALNPQGMTPLTDSLALAHAQIPRSAESADIILVTDGLENCGGDPCALAAEIAASGIAIRAHVVGFGLTEAEVNSLSCIPESTGGMLFQTNSGAELSEALVAVSEPEPQPARLIFRAIDARNGAALAPADWRIVDVANGHEITSATQQMQLDATLDAGDYTVAATYPGFAGSIDLAAEDGIAETIEVALDKILATLTLEGIDTRTGQPVPDILWTLLDLGSEEASTVRASGNSVSVLTDPGEYRIDAVAGDLTGASSTLASLDEDRILRIDMALSLPDVAITGPESVRTGEAFTLRWSETVNTRDFVAIVPMGADAGTLGNSTRTGNTTEASLRAPAEPGMYELRYILDQGRATLASQPIEVTGANVAITGPESVRTGEAFTLRWSETVNTRDFVAIVPMGADAGTLGNSTRTGNNTEASLRAPAEPGMYELRYVLDQGRATLASQPIEVTGASVELGGPERVRLGDRVRITWSETVNNRDFIAIVPMGADEGTLGISTRAGTGSTQHDFRSPEETGLYEARYVLDQGRVTIGRHVFEVLSATAPLDDGVTLSVPETAAPGTELTVTWSGGSDGGDQRLALARSDQPVFSWIEAQSVKGVTELTFILPDTPGFYEFRYLDIRAQEVLSRAIIELR